MAPKNAVRAASCEVAKLAVSASRPAGPVFWTSEVAVGWGRSARSVAILAASLLGGKKPSDKLAVIGNLLGLADRILIGGGMGYTFLAAQGHEVGNSVLEADQIPAVQAVMAEAKRRGVELVLPVDLVAATHFAPDAEHSVVPVTDFPADREGVDAGPQTRALFAAKLADAKTVFWNGPVGVFEFPAFAAGTRAVAEAIGRGGRPDRGGRRRLGRGGPRARHPRGRVQPHLDRRRREPGVP